MINTRPQGQQQSNPSFSCHLSLVNGNMSLLSAVVPTEFLDYDLLKTIETNHIPSGHQVCLLLPQGIGCLFILGRCFIYNRCKAIFKQHGLIHVGTMIQFEDPPMLIDVDHPRLIRFYLTRYLACTSFKRWLLTIVFKVIWCNTKKISELVPHHFILICRKTA